MDAYLQFTSESQALRQRLTCFVHDYVEGTSASPLQSMRQRGPVVVELYAWDGTINLAFIYSKAPRAGLASATLDWLTGLADKYRVDITGTAERVGRAGLKKEDLVAWYRRHGFAYEPADHSILYAFKSTPLCVVK